MWLQDPSTIEYRWPLKARKGATLNAEDEAYIWGLSERKRERYRFVTFISPSSLVLHHPTSHGSVFLVVPNMACRRVKGQFYSSLLGSTSRYSSSTFSPFHKKKFYSHEFESYFPLDFTLLKQFPFLLSSIKELGGTNSNSPIRLSFHPTNWESILRQAMFSPAKLSPSLFYATLILTP